MEKRIMKKFEIPKPKYDINDLVGFKYNSTSERADGVPVHSEVKGAGKVSIIEICKSSSGWSIAYNVDGHVLTEDQMKLIKI